MAQVPGAFQQARLPGGAGLEIRDNPAAFGVGNTGLERASRQLAEWADQQQREAQATGRMRVQTAAATGLAELRDRVEQMSDPNEMRAAWADGTRQLQERLGGGLSGSEGEWARNFIGMQVAQDATVINRAIRTRVRENGIAQLNTDLAEFARLADADRTEEGRLRQIGAAEAQIALARDTGIIGADDAQRLRARFAGQMEFTALNRIVGDNPQAGLALVRDTARFQNLTPEQRLQLEDRAQNGIERAQRMALAAAQRAEITERRNNARADTAINEAWQFYQRGLVPPEAVATRAAEAARVAGRAEEWRNVSTLGADVARIGAMPPAEQARVLAESDAARRAPGATSVTLQRYETITAALRQQAQDYRQNPWQRAVQDGIIDAVPPLDFGNPDSLNARVAAAVAIGERRGVAVPALSQDETRQLAQRFATGTPDEAERILMALSGVQDRQVREATFRALDNARGEGGRLERGMTAYIAQGLRSADPATVRGARELLDRLRRDVTERPAQPGERATLTAAMTSELARGPFAALRRQAEVGGERGSIAANNLNTLSGTVEQLARTYMAEGMDATAAVRRATQAVAGRLVFSPDASVSVAVIDRAAVPDVPPPAVLETGFRFLRDQAAAAGTGAQGVVAAGAVRRGVWVNGGNGPGGNEPRFTLMAQGERGEWEVVRTVTLEDVRRAAIVDFPASEAARRDARRRGADAVFGPSEMAPPEPRAPVPPRQGNAGPRGVGSQGTAPPPLPVAPRDPGPSGSPGVDEYRARTRRLEEERRNQMGLPAR